MDNYNCNKYKVFYIFFFFQTLCFLFHWMRQNGDKSFSKATHTLHRKRKNYYKSLKSHTLITVPHTNNTLVIPVKFIEKAHADMWKDIFILIFSVDLILYTYVHSGIHPIKNDNLIRSFWLQLILTNYSHLRLSNFPHIVTQRTRILLKVCLN